MPIAELPEGADVCIVGAGAAGGIIAAALVRRRPRVVMLESGPRHELAKRADYARRFLWGENPWRTALGELDRYATGGRVTYDLEWKRARGVGGSTLHWEGYALRFHANDFRLRSLYDVAEDWPITYENLEPYYGAAEKALGVAGTGDDPWASPWSSAVPLPRLDFRLSTATL